jgi:DNA-binding NarL/FixJ family response regulator
MMSVQQQFTPIRVLLADDQRLVRESLGTLLELLGGIELVATASDGEEAIALAAEHRPQVVLMDLRMPRVDGIEATRRLRECQPEVRLVVSPTTVKRSTTPIGTAWRRRPASRSRPRRAS